MKTLNFIFILTICLYSCKRERLWGDKEILVGKWRWVYTTFNGDACNPPGNPIPMTPAIKGRTESVEFIKKGKFFTYIDGEQQQEFNLKFNNWTELTGYYSFIIKLDKNDGLLISGVVSNDTLILNEFSVPFHSSSGDCYFSKSYFVRE